MQRVQNIQEKCIHLEILKTKCFIKIFTYFWNINFSLNLNNLIQRNTAYLFLSEILMSTIIFYFFK